MTAIDVRALRAEISTVRQLAKTGNNVGAHGNTLRLVLADVSDKVATLLTESGGISTPRGMHAHAAQAHVRWAQSALDDGTRPLDSVADSLRKNMTDALSHIKA